MYSFLLESNRDRKPAIVLTLVDLRGKIAIQSDLSSHCVGACPTKSLVFKVFGRKVLELPERGAFNAIKPVDAPRSRPGLA